MPEEPPAAADSNPVDDNTTDATPQAAPIRSDPLFVQVLSLMQQGQWQEAAKALEALQNLYADGPELRKVRQLLSLRVSAEESWSAPKSRRPKLLEVPVIRGLLIVNLLLYLLVGALWLLVQHSRSGR